MFNRQFSLLVIVGLLLSTDLVHANEIDGDRNLSVGNVQIRTTEHGTVIQTPKIQVNTAKATEKVLTSRTRRRLRNTVARPKRLVIISQPATSLPAQVGTSAPQATIITTPTSTPTVRSSTIRTSTNGSESVSTQQQSIQCSSDGEGNSSVSQSTSTVNGRTVRSETRTNCQ